MLKYQVQYVDFNGNKQSKDLWFHISKSDIIMSDSTTYEDILSLGKELQEKSSIVDAAQQAIEAKSDDEQTGPTIGKDELIVANAIRLMGKLLDRVIDLSYGERSADGQSFIKNSKVLESFKQSLAYDSLIDDLLSNPDKLTSFISRMIPEEQ